MKQYIYLGSFLGLMTGESIYYGSKAFKYYEAICKKGGFESQEELNIFHKKFEHIGFYPFSIIPTLMYGMNKIVFDNNYFISFPMIVTDKQYLEKMLKLIKDASEKYVKEDKIEE
jgi:hypothetical protein